MSSYSLEQRVELLKYLCYYDIMTVVKDGFMRLEQVEKLFCKYMSKDAYYERWYAKYL